jgi:hypothetical protein
MACKKCETYLPVMKGSVAADKIIKKFSRKPKVSDVFPRKSLSLDPILSHISPVVFIFYQYIPVVFINNHPV